MASDHGPSLTISPECLKLCLPDVDRLRHGGMSVEAFALSRPPVSPFVMVGDTLVKLTDPNPKSKRIYQVGEECHLVFDPDEVHVL